MKPWIKKSLIGLASVTVLLGGLTACGSRGHHGEGWSAERVSEVRGKVVDKISGKPGLMSLSYSGTDGKKPATAPVFKADKNDPFGISQTSVDFVIRGKPRPQYRDKPGWNGTRYNPSKSLQKQFGRVAIEQCLNHANTVPDFGPDVGIRMEIHFRFPPPKAGRIKNTANIDNLSKFALDACNNIFYEDN